MDQQELNLQKIHRRGIEALHEALGLTGTVRFIQLISKGSLDHMRARFEWYPDGDIEAVIIKTIGKSATSEETKKS